MKCHKLCVFNLNKFNYVSARKHKLICMYSLINASYNAKYISTFYIQFFQNQNTDKKILQMLY